MSRVNTVDWIEDEDFHCALCLTALERWATRCHRCNAFFHGPQRSDLVAGRPRLGEVLW